MWMKLIGHVAAFGLLGGALITGLRLIEYRWLVLSHSFEIYAALVATLFAGLGIWLGRSLSRRRIEVREVRVEVPVVDAEPFVRDQAKIEALGLTPRELEVLEQMAAGHSNREIAQRLFLSENTIKTHSSRVLDKLGAKRRTQAVHQGKALRLIP
ncbi:helix-turn-helix domain-containing protein [Pseudomarimonas arenosa]|uniref:Helix-turn-helix transcriptional regulator n=1 Tax=Pseudomarimonas arenosa TaxID=2774145 RepID=A0AAW3ZHX4_9GAMM|nr:helix-turn-helix transcriptional regulator [Pseudomarimonas arenosa]MBD8525598.1 helix-turn-helix transcriptional regulator [Pseudomarimonas arenosa]